MLGGDKTFEELSGLLEAEGAKKGLKVLVSDRMEAALTGPAFEITPITPAVQIVSSRQTTAWKWTILAKALGRSKLSLSLNAQLSVDGKDSQKSVRTMTREIDVTVRSAHGAWAFVEAYWAYIAALTTAVVIPLFGVLWRRRNGNATGS